MTSVQGLLNRTSGATAALDGPGSRAAKWGGVALGRRRIGPQGRPAAPRLSPGWCGMGEDGEPADSLKRPPKPARNVVNIHSCVDEYVVIRQRVLGVFPDPLPHQSPDLLGNAEISGVCRICERLAKNTVSAQISVPIV